MEFHPLANVLPLMEGEEFVGLVESIRAKGLIDPIMIYEDKILDGRNRYRACQQIGIEPHLDYLNGHDPIDYVLSKNVHRRHLTTSQRAMIAAELAHLRVGSNSHTRASANLQTLSQAEAAKLLNVSERSVATAAFVRDHGTEEEREAVRTGAKKASRIVENIKNREPETRERRNEQKRKSREPVRRARREASVVKTIIIAAQQLEAAAAALEAIDTIPALNGRMPDVIQNLRSAYQATGRFVRRLESTIGG